MDKGAAETPMRDHVARFWHLLETEYVRVIVDMRRDTSSVPYWDSSSFPNDVAKALVADHQRLQAAIRWALGEAPDADGKWFGELSEDERTKPYWWRTHLRKIAGMATYAYDKASRSIVRRYPGEHKTPA